MSQIRRQLIWIWAHLKKVPEQVRNAPLRPFSFDGVWYTSALKTRCNLPLSVYLNVFVGFFFYVDAETLKREEEAIQLDGLNVAQLKEIREKVRINTYT